MNGSKSISEQIFGNEEEAAEEEEEEEKTGNLSHNLREYFL